MSAPERQHPRRAARLRRFRRVARAGFAINGVIHFLIGGIAIRLAFGDQTVESADQSGALQQLADTVIGSLLLWGSVVGLLTLGLWQLTRATVLVDRDGFFARWGQRIVEASKGLFYLGLGATALVFALGGTTNPSNTISRISLALLQSQVGLVILVAIGLIALGSGIGFMSIGIRRTFTKLIRVPAGVPGRIVMVLGIVGYLTKGIALVAVGVIFALAAITRDASQASGLDGALRAFLEIPFGTVALTFIGAGFIVYGVFLVARTRLARLE